MEIDPNTGIMGVLVTTLIGALLGLIKSQFTALRADVRQNTRALVLLVAELRARDEGRELDHNDVAGVREDMRGDVTPLHATPVPKHDSGPNGAADSLGDEDDAPLEIPKRQPTKVSRYQIRRPRGGGS